MHQHEAYETLQVDCSLYHQSFTYKLIMIDRRLKEEKTSRNVSAKTHLHHVCSVHKLSDYAPVDL